MCAIHGAGHSRIGLCCFGMISLTGAHGVLTEKVSFIKIGACDRGREEGRDGR